MGQYVQVCIWGDNTQMSKHSEHSLGMSINIQDNSPQTSEFSLFAVRTWQMIFDLRTQSKQMGDS